MDGSVVVTDAPQHNRFEAHVESELAGSAQYIRTPELVVYPHTQVDPKFEGRGVGAALARAALDDARRRNVAVLATCPFIADWMRRHPEYGDLAYQNRSRVTD
jgi:predicted GNAT family acetyltransferase